jgi:intracellular sulfur oxidation DsrE/DsrF family protein
MPEEHWAYSKPLLTFQSLAISLCTTRHISNMVIKTNQLMAHKAKFAVCSEILTKHSTQSEHHVEFFNIIPIGRDPPMNVGPYYQV